MDFELVVEGRTSSGSGEARRLRNSGHLPAVLYSGGKVVHNISFVEKEFVRLAEKAKTTQVFSLKSSEGELNGKTAIVKDIQLNGQTGKVLHVDLQLLSDDTRVAVDVPLVVTGEAPGVKLQGGVLTTQCRKITIFALPKDIPSEIVVSVDSLKLGERIRTKDIELPEGATLKSNPEETVANVISGRAAKLAEEEAAAPAAGQASAEPSAADAA